MVITMKRLVSFALVLVLAIGLLLTSCGEKEEGPSALDMAKEYVYTLYKDVQEKTGEDYEVIGVVKSGDSTFDVVWTVDITEGITIGEKKENGMVTIGVVPNAGEVPYTLTATITDANGTTASCSFRHLIPADTSNLSEAQILELAFALKDGEQIAGKQVLRGKIVSIDTAYSEQYKNVTVSIEVAGKKVQCFRLKGGSDLAVGDTITVAGVIKNYKGTVEFDSGCTYSKTATVDEMKQIVIAESAYALEAGESMAKAQTLTGTIKSIDSAYSEQYKNITVTIMVGDYAIQCFRLKGGSDLAVGDKITVTGTIKNYKGTIEFDTGCTYTK